MTIQQIAKFVRLLLKLQNNPDWAFSFILWQHGEWLKGQIRKKYDEIGNAGPHWNILCDLEIILDHFQDPY